jgi:tripartite-type tricarboxylate transporter receptor subunit TctC
VPYKGGSQMTAGLMGNEVTLMFDSLPSPLGQIRGGKFRALAVTGAERSPVVPDVPTLKESGVNIEAIIWLGLGGPPKMPADVVAKLFDAMKQVARDADVQKRIGDMGAQATVSPSPQQFREFMLAERERWGRVIREAKISSN